MLFEERSIQTYMNEQSLQAVACSGYLLRTFKQSSMFQSVCNVCNVAVFAMFAMFAKFQFKVRVK